MMEEMVAPEIHDLVEVDSFEEGPFLIEAHPPSKRLLGQVASAFGASLALDKVLHSSKAKVPCGLCSKGDLVLLADNRAAFTHGFFLVGGMQLALVNLMEVVGKDLDTNAMIYSDGGQMCFIHLQDIKMPCLWSKVSKCFRVLSQWVTKPEPVF